VTFTCKNVENFLDFFVTLQGKYDARGGYLQGTCETCNGAPGSVYLHEIVPAADSSNVTASTESPTKIKEILILDGGGRRWTNNYYVLDEEDENSTTSSHLTGLQEVQLKSGVALQLPNDGRERQLKITK